MITIPVYLQERSVLAGTLPGSKFCIINILGQAFEHYCDARGYYKIDVTDFVRMQVTEPLTITFFNNNGSPILTEQYVFEIIGYLNPEKMSPPAPATLLPPFGYFVLNGILVLPPSVVYVPFAQSAELCLFDNGAIGNITAFLSGYNSFDEYVYQEIEYDSLREILSIQKEDMHGVVVSIKSGIYEYFSYNIQVKDFECGQQYALVEWVNRFGVKVRAFWEVDKREDAQYDAYSLYNMQNAYDYHSGIEQHLTLMLRGLNAYDFWYYSDIVTSSDVRVAIYDETTLQDSARVQVTTKKVTMPKGDAGSTLKVEVNYRRYDAL